MRGRRIKSKYGDFSLEYNDREEYGELKSSFGTIDIKFPNELVDARTTKERIRKSQFAERVTNSFGRVFENIGYDIFKGSKQISFDLEHWQKDNVLGLTYGDDDGNVAIQGQFTRSGLLEQGEAKSLYGDNYIDYVLTADEAYLDRLMVHELTHSKYWDNKSLTNAQHEMLATGNTMRYFNNLLMNPNLSNPQREVYNRIYNLENVYRESWKKQMNKNGNK